MTDDLSVWLREQKRLEREALFAEIVLWIVALGSLLVGAFLTFSL